VVAARVIEKSIAQNGLERYPIVGAFHLFRSYHAGHEAAQLGVRPEIQLPQFAVLSFHGSQSMPLEKLLSSEK